MAGSEHQNAAAHDHFLADHAAVLHQFFTSDQARSLQDLLSAHHAHLFRYVYEMETHLETSLEQLKDRQHKRDRGFAKINLVVENTRCNVLALAKKLDGAIPSHSGKSSVQNVHRSSDYADSSMLSMCISESQANDGVMISSSSQTQPRIRKPSPSFPQSSASPGLNIANEADAFHATASTVRNFGTLPNVSGTITSATWAMSNNGLYLSPESDDGSIHNSSPGSSHTQIPSISAIDSNTRDVDMNDITAPENYDQDSSEDEEIVAMQLFIDDNPSTPTGPFPPSSHNFEMEMSTCNDTPRTHISHLPSPSENCSLPHSHPTTTPSLPPLSPTPLPSPISTCGPQGWTSEPHPQIPLPEVQDQDSFDDLTRDLSPLSLLTESSWSTETTTGVGITTGNTPSLKEEDEGEDDFDSGLDPLSEAIIKRREWERVTANPTSISAVTAKQLELDQRRERKRFMQRERRRSKKLEALQNDSLAKVAVARARARIRAANGAMRNNVKGVKGKRITWPRIYKGDDEEEFYHKLIECDLCSCWYHYGCAGITPGDMRLQSTEIYICPVCITNGENKIKNKMTCSRPRCCRNQVTKGEYFVAGIAGRKLRYDEDDNVKVFYLIKWERYPVHDATWESIDAIPDPQRLIEDFEEACRAEDLGLDTSAPVLLKEAVEAGWEYVLAFTDPPGVKVPLGGFPRPENLGDRVIVKGSPSTKVESP
ncbi:hypothetical protein APHAL10511_003404 [Amanita phalloides]|nr:hypothetical protein APHAL10511_003404 [Amanita phalloides]